MQDGIQSSVIVKNVRDYFGNFDATKYFKNSNFLELL